MSSRLISRSTTGYRNQEPPTSRLMEQAHGLAHGAPHTYAQQRDELRVRFCSVQYGVRPGTRPPTIRPPPRTVHSVTPVGPEPRRDGDFFLRSEDATHAVKFPRDFPKSGTPPLAARHLLRLSPSSDLGGATAACRRSAASPTTTSLCARFLIRNGPARAPRRATWSR